MKSSDEPPAFRGEQTMNGNPSPDAAPRLPQICAGIAGGIALLALAGWQMNARFLAGQWDTYIPMAPSTALAFLLLGGALFCYARWPAQRLSRLFALAVVSLASLLALLVLAQFISGIDLGVEQALSRTNELLGRAPLGRMSPLTAIAFLLESAALFILLIGQRWRNAPTAAALLAVIATAINFVVLTGYAYGAPLLYGGTNIPVALPTAIAFVLVGMGQITMAVPSAPALAAWSRATLRGRLLRAFLPSLLVLLLIEGWLEVRIEPFLSTNRALWHSLAALTAGALIVAVTGWIAGRTGDDLEQAQARIRSLARFADENPNPVLRFARDGRLLYANPSSRRLLEGWGCEQVGQSLPEAERRLIAETLERGVSQNQDATCGEITYWLMLTPVPEMDYVNIYG
ncbi:MAG: dctB 1, partial [Anaerolineales bacterium]|nr:dctB 1 [Anaerolineales bacterium]